MLLDRARQQKTNPTAKMLLDAEVVTFGKEMDMGVREQQSSLSNFWTGFSTLSTLDNENYKKS